MTLAGARGLAHSFRKSRRSPFAEPRIQAGAESEGDGARAPADLVSPLRRALSVGGLLTLAGCGALPPPKPSTVKVTIIASPNINPTPSGQAAPIIIRIYTLKSDLVFMQSDFQSLFTNDAQTLGTDLIAKREFFMVPGTKQAYDDQMPKEAAFLGVIAAFRDIDTARWRALAPIEPRSANALNVEITRQAVVVPVVKYKEFNLL